MYAYLKPDQVLTSFNRLASRKPEGKTPMERTSVIMYFLALDAALKSASETRLDLNPDKTEGRNNRKSIELEFAKLVLLGNKDSQLIQVCELGKITSEGKSPEKRISSNFLTVPLKKATEQATAYFYPKRPAAPLIKMGQAATGIKWGMEHHNDWRSNFPKLFSEVKAGTVFTDLALFVLRDCRFALSKTVDYKDAISDLLIQRFTTGLAEFWGAMLKKEQVMVKHIKDPFVETYSPMLSSYETLTRINEQNIDTDKLKKHILYLETVLVKNNISFELMK
jgi:hypothetical protein